MTSYMFTHLLITSMRGINCYMAIATRVLCQPGYGYSNTHLSITSEIFFIKNKVSLPVLSDTNWEVTTVLGESG